MRLIFVCTGNTCRSPLAAAIARRVAAERGLALEIASAGTGAVEGTPASDGAVLVGMERGLDLSSHRSRPIDRALVGPDALVLGMTPTHVAAVRAALPEARVELLDTFASGGASRNAVADPYGGPLDDYRRAADELERLIAGALDRLARDEPSPD